MKIEEITKIVSEAVAENRGVSIDDLRSHYRKQPLVKARCMVYKILRKNYRFSLHEIGTFFCRHHASIIHGLRIHDTYMETDNEYAIDFAMINNSIMEGDIDVPLRQRALQFLEELESSRSIGKKIMIVENLLKFYDNKSIICENESEHTV